MIALKIARKLILNLGNHHVIQLLLLYWFLKRPWGTEPEILLKSKCMTSTPHPGLLVSFLWLWQMTWSKTTLDKKEASLTYNSRLYIVCNGSKVTEAGAWSIWSQRTLSKSQRACTHAACGLPVRLTFIPRQFRAQPRKPCHTLSRQLFHVNYQSKSSPTGMHMGRHNLENSPHWHPLLK